MVLLQTAKTKIMLVMSDGAIKIDFFGQAVFHAEFFASLISLGIDPRVSMTENKSTIQIQVSNLIIEEFRAYLILWLNWLGYHEIAGNNRIQQIAFFNHSGQFQPVCDITRPQPNPFGWAVFKDVGGDTSVTICGIGDQENGLLKEQFLGVISNVYGRYGYKHCLEFVLDSRRFEGLIAQVEYLVVNCEGVIRKGTNAETVVLFTKMTHFNLPFKAPSIEILALNSFQFQITNYGQGMVEVSRLVDQLKKLSKVKVEETMPDQYLITYTQLYETGPLYEYMIKLMQEMYFNISRLAVKQNGVVGVVMTLANSNISIKDAAKELNRSKPNTAYTLT
jgi:hypothetical protein